MSAQDRLLSAELKIVQSILRMRERRTTHHLARMTT